MSEANEVNDVKKPRVPLKRTTFCVRFHGDEQDRVFDVAKDNGKSMTQFIRHAVLEKCGIQPSR